MRYRWLVAGVLLIAGVSHAFEEGANTSGKAFATEINQATQRNVEGMDLGTVPGYQGSNPPQTQLYGSGLDIENRAQVEAEQNENAQYFNEARNNRPQFEIDKEHDPLFQRFDDITSRAHALSNTYEGCVELPIGSADVTRYHERTCNVSGRRDQVSYTCRRIRNVTCSNGDAGLELPFTLADFDITGNGELRNSFADNTLRFIATNREARCRWGGREYNNAITFNVDRPDEIYRLAIRDLHWDDRANIVINGRVVFSAIGGVVRVDGTTVPAQGRCEQYGHEYDREIDLRPYLRAGTNRIDIWNHVGGGGGVNFNMDIRRRIACNEQDSFTFVCPEGESQNRGTLQSRTCTRGPATIGGFYRDCWRWDDRYTRITDPIYTREPLCNELVSQGCGQVSAQCTQQAEGYCANQVLTYSCPETVAARTVSLCGNELVCANGNCSEDVGREVVDATEDFVEATTALAVMEEIAESVDMTTLTVFNGAARECEIKQFGASNCCQDGGWATDANLASCTTDERILGLQKEAGETVYIGRYTSGSFLDERRYQVYCTYPSKIARLVVQQGKPQLGMGFGSTSSPDCRGFLIQQIEQLNFDAMDFTDLYGDMERKTQENNTTPSAVEAQQTITESVSERYPQ